MARKRKTLPKEFEDLVNAGDIDALKKVFDKCEMNVYSDALSFSNIPDELVRWLVTQGADINAKDATYGKTALHAHAGCWNGDITVFLELGADITLKNKYGKTPLQVAARSYNARCVEALVNQGADIFVVNEDGMTPLEEALNYANNTSLERLAKIADIFLAKGQQMTPKMQEMVTALGEQFEFYRAGFNKDYLEATEQALFHLYQVFNVTPVAQRKIHDGVSPITLESKNWKKNYNQLWDLLVPSKGAAKTVQGEVIRISGKVLDEITRNGGLNWRNSHKKMLDAYLVYLQSGNPLDDALLEEAQSIVKAIRTSGNGSEELDRLPELSVLWVANNPNPIALGKTNY